MKNQKMEDAKDVQGTKAGKFAAGCVSIILGGACLFGIIWGIIRYLNA